MIKKLKSIAGESVTESLVGMLIAALAFVFLCMAITIGAKINATITTDDTAFTMGDGSSVGATEIQMTVENDLAGAYAESYSGYKVYKSQNEKYYYYE